jgi:MFS family permease
LVFLAGSFLPGQHLQVISELISWIISTSSLAFAGFLVLGSRASDTFGRRRFCVIGLVLFGTGLLLFASAVNVWMLVVARALAGLGGAFFILARFSLMNVLLPEAPVRHRAFSVYNTGSAVALILGFGGSGMITTPFGWRFVFLENFLLVVITILLALQFIPEDEKTNSGQRIDVGGAILIAAAAVLALSTMGKYGWLLLQGLGLFGGAVLVAGVFLRLENRLQNPLVPPSTYRYENFLGVTLARACNMAMTACSLVLLNLFMQRVLNFTAAMSGFGMLPFAVRTIAASHFIHRHVKIPDAPNDCARICRFQHGTSVAGHEVCRAWLRPQSRSRRVSRGTGHAVRTGSSHGTGDSQHSAAGSRCGKRYDDDDSAGWGGRGFISWDNSGEFKHQVR